MFSHRNVDTFHAYERSYDAFMRGSAALFLIDGERCAFSDQRKRAPFGGGVVRRVGGRYDAPVRVGLHWSEEGGVLAVHA